MTPLSAIPVIPIPATCGLSSNAFVFTSTSAMQARIFSNSSSATASTRPLGLTSQSVGLDAVAMCLPSGETEITFVFVVPRSIPK